MGAPVPAKRELMPGDGQQPSPVPSARNGNKGAAPARRTCPTPPRVLVDRKAHAEYTRGELLGEGGFARCYRAESAKGVHLAAKVVAKASLRTAKEKHKLIAEIKIHQSLAHKYIVHFHHVFEDDEFVYILMEVCENRTLVEMLRQRKRLTEPEVAYYMWQLLEAVEYMHKNNIIHRDLKLGNLFLTRDMILKIGDFGLAANIKNEGERKRTICGTPNYIAPEVLFDTQNGHSFEVDLWSVGVIMYTMIVGRPPFQTKDIKAIYKKIRDNIYQFPANVEVSESAKDIIGSLLSTKPENRPSIGAIMAHPFFRPSRIPLSIPLTALTAVPQLHFPPPPPAAPSKLPQPSSIPRAPLFAKTTVPAPSNLPHPTPSSSSLPSPHPFSRSVNALAALTSPRSIGPAGNATIHPTAMAPPHPLSRSVGVRAPPTSARPSAPPPEEQENLDHRPPPRFKDAGRTVPMAVDARAGPGPITGKSAQASPRTRPPRSGPSTSVPNTPTAPSSSAVTTVNTISNPASPMSIVTRSPVLAGRPRTAESSWNKGPPSGGERRPRNASATSQGNSSNLGPTLADSNTVPVVPTGSGSRPGMSTLERIWANLDAAFRGDQVAHLASLSLSVEEGDAFPKVFISKWIDYSNKYGLGYQLRDGAVGVYFNDSTSIILSADSAHFEYLYYEFQRAGPSISSSASASVTPIIHRDAHRMDDFPATLTKKVTLLKHFRGYMTDNLTKAFALPEDERPRTHNLHFLTKYLRTKHGVVFRLSNGVLQLNLFDHTKLILTQHGQVVTYMNKGREISTHAVHAILCHPAGGGGGGGVGGGGLVAHPQAKEIRDRLKYFQDVIHQMIVKKQTRAA